MKCDWCGKFRKPSELYAYTPHNCTGSLEPAEDEYICEACYTDERKEMLSGMWITPQKIMEVKKDG